MERDKACWWMQTEGEEQEMDPAPSPFCYPLCYNLNENRGLHAFHIHSNPHHPQTCCHLDGDGLLLWSKTLSSRYPPKGCHEIRPIRTSAIAVPSLFIGKLISCQHSLGKWPITASQSGYSSAHSIPCVEAYTDRTVRIRPRTNTASKSITETEIATQLRTPGHVQLRTVIN